MVGGLVQQQQVVVRKQQPGHGGLGPLSAAEGGHRLLEGRFVKAQSQQGGAHPAAVESAFRR